MKGDNSKRKKRVDTTEYGDDLLAFYSDVLQNSKQYFIAYYQRIKQHKPVIKSSLLKKVGPLDNNIHLWKVKPI